MIDTSVKLFRQGINSLFDCKIQKKHKKTYTGALERVHLKRWKKRKTIIEKHNNDRVASFNLGDNPYADLVRNIIRANSIDDFKMDNLVA